VPRWFSFPPLNDRFEGARLHTGLKRESKYGMALEITREEVFLGTECYSEYETGGIGQFHDLIVSSSSTNAIELSVFPSRVQRAVRGNCNVFGMVQSCLQPRIRSDDLHIFDRIRRFSLCVLCHGLNHAIHSMKMF